MTAVATQEHEVVGFHPYADKFPLMTADAFAELCDSIKANGQRCPVVVTSDGLILDGRNRWAACNAVGVEPRIEVYDGEDLAEYVIDCNASRRHMTTGARAMATALILADAVGRESGKWKYGAIAKAKRSESGTSATQWSQRLAECGVVLDNAPDLAEPVVTGELALDAAYREASDRRDAERKELDRKEREAAEEAGAKSFVTDNAPDLAEQVGADKPYRTFLEAQAIWEQRNKEEAEKKRKAEAKRKADEKAAWENKIQAAEAITHSLLILDGARLPEWRARNIADFPSVAMQLSPTRRDAHEPDAIRRVAQSLLTYADDLEQHDRAL